MPEPSSLEAAKQTPEVASATAWSLLDIVSDAAVKPLVNSALVDTYNAVAHGVNLVSTRTVGTQALGQIEPFKIAPAAAYTAEWVSQSAFRGLGSLVPYTVAGTLAGESMRGLGATFGVEGRTAALLKKQGLAYTVGAFAFDGIRPAGEGETPMGNALGGAAAMGIYNFGNRFAEGGSISSRLAARFLTSIAGTTAQTTVADGWSQNRLPTFTELSEAGAGGLVLNAILPHAQKHLADRITKAQIGSSRGAPVDLYASYTFGASEAHKSALLNELIGQNTWARVKVGKELSDFNLDKNSVSLRTANQTAGELAKQLSNLGGTRRGSSEGEFVNSRSLLLTGQTAESWQLFRQARALEATRAYQSKSVVENQLKGAPVLEPGNLALEIGAWPAPGGVSNEFRWRQEFSQFADSKGVWRPGNRLAATEPFDPGSLSADRALKQSEGEPTEAEKASLAVRTQGTELVKDLQKEGYIAAFVGGSVRDDVMGKLPKDFDIATAASPDVVAQLFRDKQYRVVETAKNHGVINVIVDGHQFEIATLRTDGTYTDGRRPDDVKFVPSLFEDAARRDLTINAMFMDPTTNAVYDFFGGKNDIAAKLIRTVGDPNQRFTEDYLRMMRVPRFVARYEGFKVAPETLDAMRKNAPNINKMAAERIRAEMVGIYGGKNALTGLKIMEDSGLMRHVFPESAELWGDKAKQDPRHHAEGSVGTHTYMTISETPPDADWHVRAALHFHDIGKAATQKMYPDGRITNFGHDAVSKVIWDSVANRLKFSNADKERVGSSILQHMRLHSVKEMRPGKVREILSSPYFEDYLAVQHADAYGRIKADAHGKVHPDELKRIHPEVMGTLDPQLFSKIDPAAIPMDRAADSNRQWMIAKKFELENAPVPTQQLGAKPIVSGKFLTEMLKQHDLKPSRRVNDIKSVALEAQHEGEFVDEPSAAAWLKRNIPEFKPK